MEDYPIKRKYVILVLPVLIVSYLLLTVCVFLLYSKTLLSAAEAQRDTLLDSKRGVFNDMLYNLSIDTGVMFYNTQTQSALEAINQLPEGETDEALAARVTNQLFTANSFGDLSVTNLYFVTSKGLLVAHAGNYGTSRSYALTVLKDVKAGTDARHGLLHLALSRSAPDVLLITRNIYLWRSSSDNGRELLGTLVVELRKEYLGNLLKQDRFSPLSFALTDAEGNVVANDTPLVGSELRAGGGNSRFSFTSAALDYDEYQLVSVLDNEAVFSGAWQLLLFAGLFAVISLVLVVGAISVASRRVASEFGVFLNKLRSTRTIDDTAFIHIDSNDEFRSLAHVYNDMLTRIRELSEKVHMQQALTREALIRAYQSQINPHFLYNTLHCISGLAEMNRTQDIQKAVSALASLERISVQESPFYTIGEDEEYLGQYLFIQKLRLGNRLLTLINIPDDLRLCAIPKLITQPIIENAVLHGIAEHKERGMISIQGKTEGEDILIEVKDNGVGFSEEALACFEKDADGPTHGLESIHRRLQLYFGEAYGLTLRNLENGGACVTVRIPRCPLADINRFVEADG